MLAAVLNKDLKIELLDNYPMPEINDIKAPLKYKKGMIWISKDDLVLLKTGAASICGTDLHILSGEHDSSPPVVLGHEYVGTVIDKGSAVKNVAVGDFVAVDPNIKCGECQYCAREMSNLCTNVTTLGIFIDGGFAEYNIVPAKQLVKLPYGLPLERAVLFEPLSCVVHGISKIKPESGESALIFGGGPIGCLFTLALKHTGVEVKVCEPNRFRRGFLNNSFGVKVCDSITKLDEDLFDIVIDASGSRDVMQQALNCSRYGGRILLFGQQTPNVSMIIPTIVNQKELQIFGSYIATNKSFPQVLRFLSQSSVPFEKLITRRLPLTNIEEAFKAIKYREEIKILIAPKEVRK